MTENAIEIQNVDMEFRLVHEKGASLKESLFSMLRSGRREPEQFCAVRGLNLSVPRGQTLGIIGHNGSGKTTTLRLLAGVLEPSRGQIDIRGRVTTLIDLGAGFNPELTGEENVFLTGALYGFSRKEMEAKFDSIVEFSELGHFVHVPVKNYSSGMSARLGFSIATDVDPDVLLVDEVLAVGDEAFHAKCFDRMTHFREAGKTIVLVSHDLPVVESFCDRVVLFDHGQVLGDGDPREVVQRYRERQG